LPEIRRHETCLQGRLTGIMEALMTRHRILHAVLLSGARVGVRLLAVAIGVPLMVVGLAMGVSLVMLPVGLVVGLFGLLLALWAMFGDVPIPARS
jgi:hypothetical protein